MLYPQETDILLLYVTIVYCLFLVLAYVALLNRYAAFLLLRRPLVTVGKIGTCLVSVAGERLHTATSLRR